MSEVVTTMEGIETKEDLEASLARIRELGPSFKALMERSEELDISVDDDSLSPEASALGDRMDAAMKKVLGKFPTEAMNDMNSFTEFAGGVGGH